MKINWNSLGTHFLSGVFSALTSGLALSVDSHFTVKDGIVIGLAFLSGAGISVKVGGSPVTEVAPVEQPVAPATPETPTA